MSDTYYMRLNFKEEVLNLWPCFSSLKALLRFCCECAGEFSDYRLLVVWYKDSLVKLHHIDRKCSVLSLLVPAYNNSHYIVLEYTMYKLCFKSKRSSQFQLSSHLPYEPRTICAANAKQRFQNPGLLCA